MKHYTRAREFKKLVEKLHEDGIQRGVYCGFEKLHEHYTVKKGVTTYLYGSPFSGKTEFWLDILITLTELHGYHHAIYTPESGSREEIVAELISKVARKPFYKQLGGAMDTDEMLRHFDFVDEYFFIVDPQDKDITVEEFYKTVEEIQKDYNIKIDTTLCDPFNELKHDMKEENGRQDLYIENKLGYIRRNAITSQRHNVVITHCTDQIQQKQVEDGKDVWFYPIPSPRQIAGGQAWYRKAMNLICIYRPPTGLKNENGEPFLDNEVHIIIQKYKPKGTGKKGTVILFYDQFKNRYYEKYNGDNRFAGEQEQQRTIYQPAYDF